MPISLTGTLEALGAFPLVNQADLLGSYRSVADVAARDAIIAGDRAEGMLVRTNATDQYWRLGAGLTNGDWVEVMIGSGGTSTVVGGFFDSPGNYNIYQLSGAPAADFLRDNGQTYSFGTLVRVNKLGGTQVITGASDNLASAWVLYFEVSPNPMWNLWIDGVLTVSVTPTDMPIGRFVLLSASYDGTDVTFYVDGKLAGTYTIATAAVAGPVDFLLTGLPTVDTADNVNYGGFFYSNAALTADQHAQIMRETVEAGRLTFDASLQALGNFAVYNADTGLGVITTWDPDPGNTLGATVPLVQTGVPADPATSSVPFSFGIASIPYPPSLLNIGSGADIAAGTSGVSAELRTLTSTDGTVTITQNASTIDFSTDPSSSPLHIYVATTGNDANAGLTALTAVATLARAMEIVPNAIAAPVYIHIASGSYTFAYKSPQCLTDDARVYYLGDGAGQLGDDGFSVIATGVAGASTTTSAIELAVDPGADVYMGYTLEIAGTDLRGIYRNAGAPSLAYFLPTSAASVAGANYRVLQSAVTLNVPNDTKYLTEGFRGVFTNIILSGNTTTANLGSHRSELVWYGVELAGSCDFNVTNMSSLDCGDSGVTEIATNLTVNFGATPGTYTSFTGLGLLSRDVTIRMSFQGSGATLGGARYIAGLAYCTETSSTAYTYYYGSFRTRFYGYNNCYGGGDFYLQNGDVASAGYLDVYGYEATGGLNRASSGYVLGSFGYVFADGVAVTNTNGNAAYADYGGWIDLSNMTVSATNGAALFVDRQAIATTYGATLTGTTNALSARRQSAIQIRTATTFNGNISFDEEVQGNVIGAITCTGSFSMVNSTLTSIGAISATNFLLTRSSWKTNNTTTATTTSLSLSGGSTFTTTTNVTMASGFTVQSGSTFNATGGTTTMSAGVLTVTGGSTVITNVLAATGTSSVANSTFIFNGSTNIPSTTFTNCNVTLVSGTFTVPTGTTFTGGTLTQTGGTWSFAGTLTLNGTKARVTTALTSLTTLTVADGADLSITGGTQSISSLSVANNSTVEITGGTFTATVGTTLASGSTIQTGVAFTTAAWTQTDSTFIATAGLFSISADSTALTIGTNSRFAAYGGITLGATTGGGITVSAGATLYVSGGTVNMRTSGLTSVVGANTYFGPSTLTACNAITTTGGTFVLAMTPTIAGNVSFTRTYVQLTNNLTVTGTVGGGTGAITISGGVVAIPGAVSCETFTVNNEAIVHLNSSLTAASGSASGGITVTENSQLVVENTISYTTASSAGLTISQGAYVDVASASAYTGNTSSITVNTGGRLRFAPATNTGVANISITDGQAILAPTGGISITSTYTFLRSTVWINTAITTTSTGNGLDWDHATVYASAAITGNGVGSSTSFVNCTVQSSSTITARSFLVQGGNVYFAGAVTVNAASFSVTNGATFVCDSGIAVTGTFGVTNATLVFTGATTSSSTVTITDSNVQASGSFTATSQTLNIYGSRFVSSSSITAGATTISRSSIVECTTLASSTTTITNARAEAVTSVTLSGDLTVSDGAVFKTATLSGNTGNRNVTINSGSSVSLTTATTNLGVFTVDNARLTCAGNLTCTNPSTAAPALDIVNGGTVEHTSGTLTASVTTTTSTLLAVVRVIGGTLASVSGTGSSFTAGVNVTNAHGLEVRSGGVARFTTSPTITGKGTGYGVYATGGSCWFEGFNPTGVTGPASADLKAGGTAAVANTTISAVNNYVTDTAGSNIGRAA